MWLFRSDQIELYFERTCDLVWWSHLTGITSCRTSCPPRWVWTSAFVLWQHQRWWVWSRRRRCCHVTEQWPGWRADEKKNQTETKDTDRLWQGQETDRGVGRSLTNWRVIYIFINIYLLMSFYRFSQLCKRQQNIWPNSTDSRFCFLVTEEQTAVVLVSFSAGTTVQSSLENLQMFMVQDSEVRTRIFILILFLWTLKVCRPEQMKLVSNMFLFLLVNINVCVCVDDSCFKLDCSNFLIALVLCLHLTNCPAKCQCEFCCFKKIPDNFFIYS